MKKIIGFLMMALIVALVIPGCTPKVEPTEPQGYDYNTVIAADYNYVDSLYDETVFYEVQVKFDTMLDMTDTPYIEYIMSVFQYKDTVILITHKPGEYDKEPVIELINDYWLEDAECTPLVPVRLDSALTILRTTGPIPATQYVTFRRPLAPPFPEGGQYIFGKGLVVIDGTTGDILYDERPTNNQDEEATKDSVR